MLQRPLHGRECQQWPSTPAANLGAQIHGKREGQTGVSKTRFLWSQCSRRPPTLFLLPSHPPHSPSSPHVDALLPEMAINELCLWEKCVCKTLYRSTGPAGRRSLPLHIGVPACVGHAVVQLGRQLRQQHGSSVVRKPRTRSAACAASGRRRAGLCSYQLVQYSVRRKALGRGRATLPTPLRISPPR